MRATASPQWTSVKRAARILGVSHDTVLRLIESGELRGWRLGSRGWWKVELNSVIAYQNTLQQTA